MKSGNSTQDFPAKGKREKDGDDVNDTLQTDLQGRMVVSSLGGSTSQLSISEFTR